MRTYLLTLSLFFCSITFAQKKVSDSIKETQLDEIVVSASRTPERVRESPVTIERMTIKDIKKTASPSYYDGLENLKEVHMNTSSLTFKSINTRGFATVANTRFMQLVDGMDNSSPLLNFVLGNMIGISELDVQNVELLPGASSALYGANAFNGILFMNSKSPFTSEGISAYVKYGNTNQKAAGSNDFHDYGIRLAHTFSKHFAAKANFNYMQGTDWLATNYDEYQNQKVTGNTRANPGYDGLNVYGDALIPVSLFSVAQGLVNAVALPGSVLTNPLLASNLNTYVSRTGYKEVDLTNNKASNTKIDFSLHFKPWANDIEMIWQSKFGFGNAVYQGGNRYYLNDFFMQQHKIEIKGKNFFVRGYTTTEDGGKSYDLNFTGVNIQNIGKPREVWLPQYTGAYIKAYTTPGSPAYGNSDISHLTARNYADGATTDTFGTWPGLLKPGSDAFQKAFNKVIAEPNVLTGSKLVDNSSIYHSDANYNFKDIVTFAEIQVGGSFREYKLNSHGRIYTDANSPIFYNEYGAYTQVTKKVLDDKLKFTGSVRYDKAKNFNGNYSPRVSLVYSAGESKKHSFRASFQTGFKNPSTQDQYIGFNIGDAVLVGSAPDNLLRYSETRLVSSGSGQTFAGGATKVMSGENAYFNSYTYTSVGAFKAAGNTALLKKTNVGLVKPEEVKAFELGYRSEIKEIYFDINGYYNIYNDFIGNQTVIAPLYGKTQDAPSSPLTVGSSILTDLGAQTVYALSNGDYRVYQLYTNTTPEIQSLGFGLGVSRKVFGNYEISANYNYAEFKFDQAKDPSFEAQFNTPKHRVKASFGNEKLFENFGFNTSVRWNSEYLWQSTMVDGMIDAATVIDAQINYGLPKLKSVLKIGATNIGGKEYTQVLGAGAIGQQYFASLTINP